MRSLAAVLLTLVAPWSVLGQNVAIISTFAGCAVQVNIPGTSASLSAPEAVAVDSTGNVFFSGQNAIVRLDATTGILTLVAGNGMAGFSGDNGLASNAQLSGPEGVAVDSAGNLYIADTANNRIRKVTNGVITTVAGNGSQGSNGDNGSAINAQLNNPNGIAVDSAGNLYIADTNNSRIRMVTNGMITTLAGNGTAGFGGDNGPATGAQLNYPFGVAVDSAGDIYIADSDNDRIRRVTNGVITTLAGTGTAGFSGDNGLATSAELSFPADISVDSSGSLYIADEVNNRIRKITNGVITTVTGGGVSFGDSGPATSAQLNAPAGVAVDSVGNVYVADSDNNRIRKVTSGVITTVAGGGSGLGDNGPATSAYLNGPAAVAADSAGNVYIADSNNGRIRMVTNGVITTVAGDAACCGFSGDDGPATSAQLNYPHGVTVDSANDIYIADTYNNRIREVTNAVITTVVGGGSGGDPATSASLFAPNGVAVDSAGDIYIADTENRLVREVTNGVIATVAGGGLTLGDNGPATGAELSYPSGVAVDSAGSIYIADYANNRIRKVSNGVITTVAGNGTVGFGGDNGPAINAQLAYPMGIAVDSAGGIYIADSGNNRIRKVTNGVIATVAGGGSSFGDGGPAPSAQLSSPTGVAVDFAGNIYIADQGNNRIRVVQPLATSQLTVSKTHVGNFALGQQGATYTVTVSNGRSLGATAGLVTVMDSLPAGLILASMSGAGWSCSRNICSRSDVLNPGSSYPAITVAVNVASSVLPQVTNQVTVWGGGSDSAGASDVTIITGQAPGAVITFSPSQGATGVAPTTALTWGAVSGAAAYNVYFGTSSTPSLATSTTGTSYSPVIALGTTYYWSVTALNAFGSTPSAVWSFSTAPIPNTSVIYTYIGNRFTSVSIEGYSGLPGTAPPPPTLITVSLTFAASLPANVSLVNESPALVSGWISDGDNSFSLAPGCSVSGSGGTVMLSTNNVGLPITQWSVGYNCTGRVVEYIMSTSTLTGQIEDAGSEGGCGEYACYSASNANSPGTWTMTVTPPTAVTAPTPGQGAAGVPTGPRLTWEPVSGATSYSVYFGTSSAPSQIATNLMVTSYYPGDLIANTTYYWSVTATNLFGSTPSGIWSFTTGPQTTGVTIQTSPSGLQFSVDGGAAQTAPQTLNLSQGAHTIAVATTQAGAPSTAGTQFVFSTWNDGGAASHTITVGSSAATYSATFTTQYLLTTTISPTGSGSVAASPPSNGYYNAGTSVQLTASANAGYLFINWTGNLSGSSNPQFIAMSAPQNVTANFSTSSGCSFSLSPASASVPATGTSVVETCPNNSGRPNCGVTPEVPLTFAVTPAATCGAWTATSSNPGVLQITSGATGSGAGSVGFTLLNNTHNGQQSYTITLSSGATTAIYPVTEAGSGDSQVYREVYALYEQLLGRDPDMAGFTFWTGAGDIGLGQMADSFLTSPEAFDSDFAVMAAYQAVTGGPPTYAQFTAAVASIRARTQTVGGLFNALIGSSYTATNLYQNLLNRQPSGTEISNATNVGLTVWFEYLIGYPGTTTPINTPNNEFQSTGTFHTTLAADHTNSLYVQMIYYVTVSRDPDAAGLAFWTGVANSGGPGLLFQGSAGAFTRNQILGPGTPNQGFIGSPEFQGLFAN